MPDVIDTGGSVCVVGLVPNVCAVTVGDAQEGVMLEVTAGTAVSTTASFLVGGVATDPTAVTLKIRSGQTSTTWTYGGGQITKSGIGQYTASVDTTPDVLGAPGVWVLEWAGTSPAAAVQSTEFLVDPAVI